MSRSPKGFTGRTKARKRALDVLFEADQKGLATQDGIREILEDRKTISAAQTPMPDYAIAIVAGVAAHIGQIDDLISTYSQGWELGRMPGVDRSLLRMASWEILYNPDIDAAVAINEAITIAKAVSTDDSPNFLNGLLGKIQTLAGTV